MTTIPERARTIAALKVIADVLKKQDTAERADLLKSLADMGVKGTVEAAMPDGTVLGTVTVCKGKTSARVTDRAAFLEWVKVTHPDQIATVTTTSVRPAFESALMAVATELKAPVDKQGEAIPGVTIGEGDPYLTTKLAHGAAKVVMDAVRAGTLQPLALPGGAS